MQKFSLLFFLCIFTFGFSQSVELKKLDGSLYPDVQSYCNGETFNLKVDAAASSTGDYAISSAQAADFPLSAGGDPIIFQSLGSNKFSKVININFPFSFYGKNYSKVVAGSNGRLVFTNDPKIENLFDNTIYVDRAYATVSNLYKLPTDYYNKVYVNDPDAELNLAQIFSGYTYLVPQSQLPSVRYFYKEVIHEGKKGLLISFQNQTIIDYSSAFSSSVLLLEDGRVVVYVFNKLRDNYNAILGIQNDNATKSKVPAHSNNAYDYNHGPWLSEGKAWVFTPNQNLTPKFKWTNNGVPLAETTNTLTGFGPANNDVLKVEVSYVDPDNGTQIGASVSDQVLFKSLQTPVITTLNSTCAQIDLETASIPNVTYEWRKVGSSTVLSTTNKLAVTESGDYIVKIIRNGSAGLCSLDSAPISLALNSSFPPFNDSPKFICKNDGSSQLTVNLNDYYPANPTQYTLTFQENGVDIPSPNNSIIINADQTRTITILAVSLNTTAHCSFTKTFDLTFLSLPLNNSEFSPNNLCFGTDTYNLGNFENQYFSGKNYQFTYSLNGGTSYQPLTSINPQVNNLVFVKIKHPNFACETVVKLKFNFNPKVIANTPTTVLPAQCSSSFSPFNLNSLKLEINPGNVTITYHNTLNGAIDDNDLFLNDSSEGSKTVYIRVVDNVTLCVSVDHPSITLLVYAKPTLLLTSIPKSNCQGNSKFNLTQNIADLVTAAAPITVTLEYHAANGDLLTGSQITAYDEVIYGPNPYIKVSYNTTCSDIVTFDLSYYPKPSANTSPISICTETTYSLQDFKNKVALNPSQYTFTDVSGNPLPANFNLSILPLPVNFLMKDITTGCVSDLQTVTFIKGASSALLTLETDFIDCDKDFDGKLEFDLDTKKSFFTSDTSAKFEYFKDFNLTQSIAAKYTNETAFTQPVYIRIRIPGFCPTKAKINLIANIPTKSTTLEDKYFICFGETLRIDAGNENTIFDWSDGQSGQFANFTKTGSYSVTLKNGVNGCPYTHNFTISDVNQPMIDVINQTSNSIEVSANGGVKPYKYYFNGVAQTSNILSNPKQSSYKIQVESATGCLGPPKTVYFIKINNAFSPNGDGINDLWRIDNLDKMDQVSIVIIDRNGKKVFESTTPTKNEWDGKDNGRALPTSSYWYVISWYDPVTQKSEQRQGWILMKNRN